MKKCFLFRRRIYELLVDPASTPAWLKKKSEVHRQSCSSCQNLFEESQRAQQFSAKIIAKITMDDRLQSIMKSQFPEESTDAPKTKTLSRWLCAAIIFVVAYSLSPIFSEDKIDLISQKKAVASNLKHSKFIETSKEEWQSRWERFSEELVTYFTKSENLSPINAAVIKVENPQVNTENKREKLHSLLGLISMYAQQVEKEFVALEKLLRDQEPSQSLLLAKHLRFTLVNSESRQKLTALQSQNYPANKVKSLFDATNNINDAEFEKVASAFFREAGPHLLNIWKYRFTFVDNMDEHEIERFGGETQLFSLIGNIENTMCF